MTRPVLNLQKLRSHFAPRIFERGEGYQRGGEVLNLTLRDHVLTAGVQGSDTRPYRVTLTLSEDDMRSADCTCPYGENFGDYCKHIAAVALEYYHRPDTAISEASVTELLSPLDAATLRSALEHLLELYPDAADRLELYLQRQASARRQANDTSPSRPAERAPSLDTRLFEKMMRSAVRGASYDWDGFPEYREVYEVIEEVKPFLARGAYREALELSRALTDTFIDEVNSLEQMYDGIGSSDEGIFADFDAALTEGVLGTRLTGGERKRLLHEVLAWNDQIGNEWTSPEFAMAAHALAEGLSPQDDEAQDLLKEVARLKICGPYEEIRLRVLRATGRSEDALALAKQTEQGAGYLETLLDLGRLAQVINEYPEHLKTAADALSVARQLADEHPGEALHIAQHGLSLEPERPKRTFYGYEEPDKRLELASFTRTLASRLGEHDATLSASLLEFELEASLPRYEALRTLVSADWPQLKSKLHQDLRRASYPNRHAAADIFLSENLPGDAVSVASAFESDDALLRKVMDAVTSSHAPWVSYTARKRADPIMDEGRSNHYSEAARWLSYVKSALTANGQEAQWKAYIAEVRQKHRRKYRLMEALEGL